jgi:hypothetical protein
MDKMRHIETKTFKSTCIDIDHASKTWNELPDHSGKKHLSINLRV